MATRDEKLSLARKMVSHFCMNSLASISMLSGAHGFVNCDTSHVILSIISHLQLREYQGRIKDPENQSKGRTSQQSMSSSSSPGPSILQSLEEGSTRRTESPFDSARVTWERRETLPISESQMIENLQEQIRESEQNASMERTATQEAVHNEISQLHLQMQNQAQALNVLISERNEAHAALSRVQSELHHRTGKLQYF